jgi:FdhD protein
MKETKIKAKPTKSLPVAVWAVQQWHDNHADQTDDRIVMEEPFEVRVNGRSLAAIMRTPDDIVSDRELAMGFLLTEGIISDPKQVQAIKRVKDKDGLPAENVLDVRLPELPENLFGSPSDESARFERRFTVASSCGLCGKNSIVEVCRRLNPLETDDFQVSVQVLYRMPDALRTEQAIFDHTGGLHAAGLFTPSGELVVLREDLGRHNAVDKIIGSMALQGRYPLAGYVLLVSGRISFEIVQKALAARIPLVAAISAPSSLALELAEESGVTLVGFLRGKQCNVYTHPERVR